jgi:erythromycin esterase
MSRRVAAVLIVALLLGLPAQAQRRRSVLHPSEETPGGWLTAHAFPLATTEAVGRLDDLEPLRAMVGTARVVGLADGTHGTHEYFTSKLRLIQFLVTQMQFDTVAFEHSYSQAERLNSYVHGANIDVRSGVFPAANEVRYPFWQTEELIAVVEWIRNYNLTRGEKQEVNIAGIDIYGGASAAAAVVTYLRGVDADAANAAATTYSCVTGSYGSSTPCRDSADALQKQIAAKQSDYVARSSLAAFREASHAATVVVQSFGYLPDPRNEAMARNTVWAREQRSATGRIIVWAHAEHLGKTPSLTEFARTSMGGWMKDFFDADFFAIGTRCGTARTWASTATRPPTIRRWWPRASCRRAATRTKTSFTPAGRRFSCRCERRSIRSSAARITCGVPGSRTPTTGTTSSTSRRNSMRCCGSSRPRRRIRSTRRDALPLRPTAPLDFSKRQ